MGAALVAAGDRLGYLQVADSQRQEPGAGHIDFAPIFDALDETGFRGDIGLECSSLSGDPAIALPSASTLLRDLLREAAERT